jgi:hypothetical protein
MTKKMREEHERVLLEFLHRFAEYIVPDEDAPKCAEEGCENHAAKNQYYPNSDGDKYWTLCEECYDQDQDDE